MAHKLHPYREQIELLKANRESVRSIASKLSELSGEKIAPSTVHHFLKQGSGNGESKESIQIDQAAVLERLDYVAFRLDELEERLSETKAIWGYLGVLSTCVERAFWLTGGSSLLLCAALSHSRILWAGAFLCAGGYVFATVASRAMRERVADWIESKCDWAVCCVWDVLNDALSRILPRGRKAKQDFFISPYLAVRKDEVNNDRP